VKKFVVAITLLVAVVGAAVAVGAPGGSTGPSSSESPYLVRTQPGVVFRSILTTGDSVPKAGGGTYRMPGIPDGLGAFDNGDGTFTVLMNHEIGNSLGVTRAHGGIGAFVSRWVINKSDLSVVSGRDEDQTVNLWSGSSYTETANVPFNRFCSADLASRGAFYNPDSGKGYDGRIYLNGEESSSPFGRGFAHVVADSSAWELPWLGKMAFENSLANPGTGDRTVVVSQDDAGGGKGQVYVYVGDKKTTGNAVEMAGLTGGTLYGINVDGTPAEPAASGIPSGTAFSAYSFGDVSTLSGADLETASNDNGVTQFRRPEDGAWDPVDPNTYYFVTTDSFGGKSRLWRLKFADAAHPELGGTIDMLLDGTEGQQMLDNIGPNRHGQIVLLEDIGEQTALGKVWFYDIASDTLTQIAKHDPSRFAPGGSQFITADEESSGVIDASSILGSGWYLLDVQAHSPWNVVALPKDFPPYNDAELVEGGQLLALHIAPGKP
jgi:hypothetical protein